MPQKEISAPIRDDIIDSIAGETAGLIRSTYNEKEGFYIINFPTIPVQWVCDVRKASEGIFRWTKWNTQIYGIATGSDNTLYGGLAAGYLADYDGYYDTDTSDGNVDKAYILKYRSSWFDPGMQTSKSIWKKLVWYIASLGTINPITTWAFDFSGDEKSQAKQLVGISASKYGSFKYGSGTKYGGSYTKQRLQVNLKGVGSVIMIGFQSVVNGGKFAFNKADLFFKSGRIR
jgi:hypothetical protein